MPRNMSRRAPVPPNRPAGTPALRPGIPASGRTSRVDQQLDPLAGGLRGRRADEVEPAGAQCRPPLLADAVLPVGHACAPAPWTTVRGRLPFVDMPRLRPPGRWSLRSSWTVAPQRSRLWLPPTTRRHRRSTHTHDIHPGRRAAPGWRPRTPVRERRSWALRYHVISEVMSMPDLLIRNFPADDLERLDARAAALGLSRSEYLRRRLRQDARSSSGPVSVTDLQRFAATFSDLADDAIMSQAWR